MAIDRAKVETVAATLLDSLEETYGEDAEITDVMLIAAVDYDGGEGTSLHFEVNPGMAKHVGIGLLNQINYALLASP